MDDATELFYDLLSAAISDFIPLVQLRRRQPPWFDRELRAALREKEAAHRRMRSAGTADSRELFGEKRRVFKRLASERFSVYLNGLVDDLKTNPKRFWSYVKCMKGRNGQISYLLDGDRKVTDDRQKVDLLNRTFASKFSNQTVTELPPAPEYDLDPLRAFHVTEDAVRGILCNLNPHKACGPDSISARVIRECAVELSIPIPNCVVCRWNREFFLDRGNVPISCQFTRKAPKRMPVTIDLCRFYYFLARFWKK